MSVETDFTQALGRLEELEKKVQKTVQDKALKAGAQPILMQQKIGVPKDSGDLARSLQIGKIKGSGAKRNITIGIAPEKAEQVRYGYYQEYGTDVMLGKKWMKSSYKKASEQALKKISAVLVEELRG